MSERKDIDAIVGATVKLEESLNKRITELEKNGERDYDNIDANRGQINFNLKGIKDCWKLLAKLKELIQKIGVKLDFTSQEAGQSLKEIAELKDKFENHQHLLNGTIIPQFFKEDSGGEE